MFQQKIYSIINKDINHNLISRIYDWVMLVMIILSIVPLMFITDYRIFRIIDIVTVTSFIIDYLLRWYCSPIQLGKGLQSYVIYPFTPMAIVDLL